MNPFPRLNADLFLKTGNELTAEAGDLGFRAGETPHGNARGVNVGGKGYFLENSRGCGWTYRHPIDGDVVIIFND